jgi:hypothetical protein
MAEARYFCPECGSMELSASVDEVVLAKSADSLRGSESATCHLCGWSGTLKETLGAVSSEEFYDIEKIGNILLRVFAKHGTGPIYQSLVLVGLIEKDDEVAKDKVLKAVTEAALTAAFSTAAEHSAARANHGN